MATDTVAQLADSLASTGVGEGELSYKGEGRKLDDAKSGRFFFCSYSSFSLITANWILFVHLLSPQCIIPAPCSVFLVEEMVKEIQDFKGLQALRLEGNTVGVEAAQAIAKALETKSELKVWKNVLLFSIIIL